MIGLLFNKLSQRRRAAFALNKYSQRRRGVCAVLFALQFATQFSIQKLNNKPIIHNNNNNMLYCSNYAHAISLLALARAAAVVAPREQPREYPNK